jgi:hypothetical protein
LKEGSDEERERGESESEQLCCRRFFCASSHSPLLDFLLSSSSPQLPLPFFILSIDQNSPTMARIKAAALALLAAVLLLGSSVRVRLFVLCLSGKFES